MEEREEYEVEKARNVKLNSQYSAVLLSVIPGSVSTLLNTNRLCMTLLSAQSRVECKS